MVDEYWLDGERWLSWYQWKAEALNRLFREQGRTGEAGKITAETVEHGEKPLLAEMKQHAQPDQKTPETRGNQRK
jgi:hypothetical protein